MFFGVAIDKLQKKRAAQKDKEEKSSKPKKYSRTWFQNICEVMTGDYREGPSINWIYPFEIKREMIIEKEYL